MYAFRRRNYASSEAARMYPYADEKTGTYAYQIYTRHKLKRIPITASKAMRMAKGLGAG